MSSLPDRRTRAFPFPGVASVAACRSRPLAAHVSLRHVSTRRRAVAKSYEWPSMETPVGVPITPCYGYLQSRRNRVRRSDSRSATLGRDTQPRMPQRPWPGRRRPHDHYELPQRKASTRGSCSDALVLDVPRLQQWTNAGCLVHADVGRPAGSVQGGGDRMNPPGAAKSSARLSGSDS